MQAMEKGTHPLFTDPAYMLDLRRGMAIDEKRDELRSLQDKWQARHKALQFAESLHAVPPESTTTTKKTSAETPQPSP